MECLEGFGEFFEDGNAGFDYFWSDAIGWDGSDFVGWGGVGKRGTHDENWRL